MGIDLIDSIEQGEPGGRIEGITVLDPHYRAYPNPRLKIPRLGQVMVPCGSFLKMNRFTGPPVAK